MAVAMARLGGIGILHRMQTIEDQVEQLGTVKTVPSTSPVGFTAAVDGDRRLAVGAAVGTTGDYIERAHALAAAGADVLVVDVAHGHSDHVIAAVRRLREEVRPALVAGNVATAAAVRDLVAAGAAAVKVGIGPGGVCTTRRVTGCGVPQLTAILDCATAARELGVTLIADGGIRAPGDVTKALAAGADTVMLGSALAGTDESAALLVDGPDGPCKMSRGFATMGMTLTLKLARGEEVTQEELDDYTPEGIEMTFAYAGPLRNTIQRFRGGLRSGMSYCGAETISDLRRAEFIPITNAGASESRPHAAEATHQLPFERTAHMG
jgi:IMP dehydrogenase/GMP reductase